jgi:FKBP-type peptidyl-prolyl cis-trans isomerase 2
LKIIKVGEGFMLPNWQASLDSISQDLKEAKIDLNHPLAWKILNFEILVKEIK